jgi:anti-anti-sigma factor
MSRRATKRESSRAGRPPAADAVAAVSGELTIYHVAQVREELAGHLGRGVCRFDLSGVAELDSSGLQLLAALRNSVAQAGRQALFLQASDPVRAACALCGLDSWLAPQARAEAR